MSGKDKKQKPRKHAVKQAEGVVDKTSKPAEQSAAIVKATASVDKAVSVPSKSAKDSKDKKRKQGKPVGTVTKKPSRLRFFVDAFGELKKAHWPSRKETYRLSVLVFVVCVVVGAFLGALDLVFTKMMGLLLMGG
ncbi:preprotein translocase subunit SecE [Candidatus Bipolaricaulota bacterium]|nr:preprotein translocase subunit SecE [Candidatus Bipolaricaulota bacterium]